MAGVDFSAADAIDDAETERCGSARVVSTCEVLEAQCCDKMDLDSSIGVKIDLDFTDIRFTGSSICAGGATCVCAGGCCGCDICA